MMAAMTKRQREVYDFVCGFIEANGFSPSLMEIGEALGLRSVGTTLKHVQALVEKGFLHRQRSGVRAIEPAEVGPLMVFSMECDPEGVIELRLRGDGLPGSVVERLKKIASPEGVGFVVVREAVL